MKVVVQRCKHGDVHINNALYNEINEGMVLLVGFTQNDSLAEIDYMVKKIINLRIFDDENGVMNKSIQDVKGSILSISQFTLYGDATKGNRPSYIKALNGAQAIELYKSFNRKLNDFVPTKTGVFGAEMLVNIQNNGPVTILLEK